MIFLILTTIIGLLFVLYLNRGAKYEYLVENLDSKEFPLKSMYGVGYVWGNGFLKIPTKVYVKFYSEASILYEPKYAEYYARLTWAQMITFVHLGLTFGFVLRIATNSNLMLFFGVAFAAFCGFYFYSNMGSKVKEIEKECNMELPEVSSTMALLVNSGMILNEAWEKIAYSKEGKIYELMRNACTDMKNGVSEIEAIYKFGVLSGSAEIKKFSSSIAQALEKGGSELGMVLTKQSSEMWDLKRQLMLQKGEAAASKLIGPIACIFVGVIILVVAGALGMLTL